MNDNLGFNLNVSTDGNFSGVSDKLIIKKHGINSINNCLEKNGFISSYSDSIQYTIKNSISDFVNSLKNGKEGKNFLFALGNGEFFIIFDGIYCKIKSYESTKFTIEVVIDFYSKTIDDLTNFKEYVETCISPFVEQEPGRVYVEWYAIIQGRVESYKIATDVKEYAFPEAYPFLKYEMNEYIEKFLNSQENILILYGIPGTGKTRLIRQILKRLRDRKDMPFSICCTNNPRVIEDESFYFDFLSDEHEIMVLEDCDYAINSRKEAQNDSINKLLFSSDGLIQHNKKLIFSTNINVEKRIDTALLRSGRCFDAVKTRKLTFMEIKAFIEAYNKKYGTEFEYSGNGEKTIAEVYKNVTGLSP